MSWNPNDNDPWGRKNSPPDLEEKCFFLVVQAEEALREEVQAFSLTLSFSHTF